MIKHVLVLEDNKIESLKLSKIIESAGHVPIVAEDGFTALEACEKYIIDAALVDIQMPHMSGYDFLHRLKGLNLNYKIPIIMMTASKHDLKHIKEAITLGAKDFIIKPCEIEIITSKINSLFKNKKNDWTENIIVNQDIKTSATTSFNIKVVSINEMGLRISSQIPFEKHQFIEINWPAFLDIGVGLISLQVFECIKEGNTYSSYLTFIGLGENKLKLIRQLCIKAGLGAKYPMSHVG